MVYSKSQYDLKLLKDVDKANEYNGFPPMTKSRDNVKRLYKEVFAQYLN